MRALWGGHSLLQRGGGGRCEGSAGASEAAGQSAKRRDLRVPVVCPCLATSPCWHT